MTIYKIYAALWSILSFIFLLNIYYVFNITFRYIELQICILICIWTLQLIVERFWLVIFLFEHLSQSIVESKMIMTRRRDSDLRSKIISPVIEDNGALYAHRTTRCRHCTKSRISPRKRASKQIHGANLHGVPN